MRILQVGLLAGLLAAGAASADSDGIFRTAFETPIVADANAWTWVPVDRSTCANGTPTGIGVNPNPTSTRLLIYLEGGGACWSTLTCYVLNLASNFSSGYGAADFAATAASSALLGQPNGLFDRLAISNPLRDYNYVYVPYCTGDNHAGNNVVQYGSNTARHVGHRNLGAYLDRVVETFPHVERVILVGSSAGGFGAAANWWRTQRAFGPIRVDLIDDSGTPMPASVVDPNGSTPQTQRTQWNLAATLPPGCSTCLNRLDTIFSYYAGIFPDRRAALLSYTSDPVLSLFFGISNSQFTVGLNEVITNQFDPYPNFHTFIVGGSNHVLWTNPALTATGISLAQWIGQMVNDDPAWTSR